MTICLAFSLWNSSLKFGTLLTPHWSYTIYQERGMTETWQSYHDDPNWDDVIPTNFFYEASRWSTQRSINLTAFGCPLISIVILMVEHILPKSVGERHCWSPYVRSAAQWSVPMSCSFFKLDKMVIRLALSFHVFLTTCGEEFTIIHVSWNSSIAPCLQLQISTCLWHS